jgi:hypothetical protein
VPYVAIQSMLDGGAPHGLHYYWRSHRLRELSSGVIDEVLAGLESITSPLSQIGLWAVGGAASRVDPSATAVGAREEGFEVNVVGAWTPSDDSPSRHIGWVRGCWDALQPWSTGVYANFLSDEGSLGVKAAYGARLARLTALKDRFDPTNFFRMNGNIPPSGSA